MTYVEYSSVTLADAPQGLDSIIMVRYSKDGTWVEYARTSSARASHLINALNKTT